MKFFLVLLALGAILGGGFFLLKGERVVEVVPSGNLAAGLAGVPVLVPAVPEAETRLTSSEMVKINPNPKGDIQSQNPLENPPEAVKAIYATGWSAGSAKKLDYLIKLMDETELNAIVIDVKDYSGYVSYYIDHPLIKGSGALNEPRILKPNALIKKLHDKGIYAIGRISVFQDSVLAKAHPEWAVRASSSGDLWRDKKGLAWMDPASREVWDYNLAVAKDALARGFDELNFDYIRFPSDGNLDNMRYPFWDEKTSMAEVMEDFFRYSRANLPQAKISADLFGLATIEKSDLGIGQVLERAFPYFDYIAPMVYPSHYADGIFGYKNPADYPYEVVKNSLAEAAERLAEYNTDQINKLSSSSVVVHPRSQVKFRPWLQDFDLGADYDADKVRAQIRASEDVFCSSAPSSSIQKERSAQICDSSSGRFGDKFGGWMLWDSQNNYTKEALLREN